MLPRILRSCVELRAGGECETDEIAVHRIDGTVDQAGAALQRAVKIPPAQRPESHRIHRHRQRALPEREQHAAVHQHAGVGQVTRHPPHAVVIQMRIAVLAEQRAAGAALGLPALRSRIAALQADPAVRKPEHRDQAIAVEGDVVRKLRREDVVCRGPVEGAVDDLRRGQDPTTSRSSMSTSAREGALTPRRSARRRSRTAAPRAGA
ncbi:MAG: hypothetical protein QM757_34080, partial [Paludibaculum sp.]